ncbi:PREDICTED: larval cuticle protein LCP-17-like [Nicrophorus vespilloides]|uniref:Larval cuticle protein LCP-17-like n=1 Tax=Nicrophorus vespilloides TaxID=110193 RepID=A0ABM1NFZ1_NICVS|nr:PREDICTED: larval cuticle protein LCP-17-like [Nicrophorus vespilloides]
MRRFIIVFVAIAACNGFNIFRPTKPTYYKGLESDAKIIAQDLSIDPDGSYHYKYKTENGIYADQSTFINKQTSKKRLIYTTGKFHWTSPEGQLVKIGYIVDENGYQPEGNVLPTPPPIPAPILKALKYIESKKQQ